MSDSRRCTVRMYDANCSRPATAGHASGNAVCHMHLPDGRKDAALFTEEIAAILRPKQAEEAQPIRLDFSGFHFPSGFEFPFEDATSGTRTFPHVMIFRDATFHAPLDLGYAEFLRGVDFTGAVWSAGATFEHALFEGAAHFERTVFQGVADFSHCGFIHGATFERASFHGAANFSAAIFTGSGDFAGANFLEGVDFAHTVFSETLWRRSQETWVVENLPGFSAADFRHATFAKPERVVFYRVNRGDIRPASRGDAEKLDFPGVRVYLANCNVKDVQFNDVNWHRIGGRIALWDEVMARQRSGWLFDFARRLGNRIIDRAPTVRERSHAAVGIAYRRLMSNFDAAAQSDLAEDCYVGAMEIARIDRSRPLSERLVLQLYRWLSNYGSSYRRALFVLVFFIVAFAVGYALPLAGLAGSVSKALVNGAGASAFRAGLLHSLEVATFQRDMLHVATTTRGHTLEIVQSVLMPAQLALFLLALRRRLKR